MELSEKDRKEVKRFTDFARKTKKFNIVCGSVAIAFAVVFIAIGVYYFLQVIPRFSIMQGAAYDEIKIVYTLWCYTFILLGFSTFLTGYLMLQYCKDVYFLFTLCERAGGIVECEAGAAKEPVKEAAKEPVKEEAKEPVKEAAKEPAKEEAKEPVKEEAPAAPEK